MNNYQAVEPVEVQVTLTSRRVTGIVLDPLSIDHDALPGRASLITPKMARTGLLQPLHDFDGDRWTASCH